ncbi:hypothetical protein ABK040_011014 [Willaertia magna]
MKGLLTLLITTIILSFSHNFISSVFSIPHKSKVLNQKEVTILLDVNNGFDNYTKDYDCQCGNTELYVNPCETLKCALSIARFLPDSSFPIIKISKGIYNDSSTFLSVYKDVIIEGIDDKEEVNINVFLVFQFGVSRKTIVRNLTFLVGVGFSYNASPTIDSVQFINNYRGGIGTVIYGDAKPLISNTLIDGCRCLPNDNGIINIRDTTLTLQNVIIQNTDCDVFSLRSSNIIIDNLKVINVTNNLFKIIGNTYSSIVLNNGFISNINYRIINSQSSYESQITISNSLFYNTKGIYIYGGGKLEISNSTFTSEYSNNIYVDGFLNTNNDVSIDSSIFENININFYLFKIYVKSKFEMSNTIIRNNTASTFYLIDDYNSYKSKKYELNNVIIKDNIFTAPLFELKSYCEFIINNTIITNNIFKEALIQLTKGTVEINNSTISCDQPTTLLECYKSGKDTCEFLVDGRINNNREIYECANIESLSSIISLSVTIGLGFLYVFINVFGSVWRRFHALRKKRKIEQQLNVSTTDNNTESETNPLVQQDVALVDSVNTEITEKPTLWKRIKKLYNYPDEEDYTKYQTQQFDIIPTERKYTRIAYRSSFSKFWLLFVEFICIIIVLLSTLLTGQGIAIVTKADYLLLYVPSVIVILSIALVFILPRGNRIINAFYCITCFLAVLASISSMYFSLRHLISATMEEECEEREFHSWNDLTIYCILYVLPLWIIPFRMTSIVNSFELTLPFNTLIEISEHYLSKTEQDHILEKVLHGYVKLLHAFCSVRCFRHIKDMHVIHVLLHITQLVYEIVLMIIAIITKNFVSLLAICVGLFGAGLGIINLHQFNIICNSFAIYLSFTHLVYDIMHLVCAEHTDSNIVYILFMVVGADCIRIANILHSHLKNREFERFHIYKWFVNGNKNDKQ